MSISCFDDQVALCRALVVGYHLAIDRGGATSAIDAFTDDAVFEIRGQQLRGRREILDFLTRRESQVDRQTVHEITNEHVIERGQDRVVLGALVLLHLRGADGRYELEKVLDSTHALRRTAQGWRIAERSSRPLHPPIGDPA